MDVGKTASVDKPGHEKAAGITTSANKYTALDEGARQGGEESGGAPRRKRLWDV